MEEIVFARYFAMPNACTFSIKPIRELLDRYITAEMVVVDPFARNSSYATYANDLDPNTNASHHLEAREFLNLLIQDEVKADVVILDPPYSPRQISECYKKIGLKASSTDTQNAMLCAECKDLMSSLLKENGIAITCGWNSNGFGKSRGFKVEEILLVQHGGAHNDTIVTVERKMGEQKITSKPRKVKIIRK